MGRLPFFLILVLAVVAASCGNDEGSLLQAAKLGDLVAVKRFLADGANIDEPDAGGFTPLHASIMNGHRELTGYLIDEGADVNAVAIYGVAPLHVATDADTVRRLLEHGARIDAWSKTRGTPLHAAVKGNSIEAVDLLIRSDAPLYAADIDGSSALHHAAGMGREDVVALLINSGASVDALNTLGFTPLHWAAGNGHTRIAAMLIESGAARSLRGYNGSTPRDMALAKGHDDVVLLLDSDD